MKYLLNKSQFESLLEYAATNDQNLDATRCFLINVTLNEIIYELTLCFNEHLNQIVICQIYNESGHEITNEKIKKECFAKLIDSIPKNSNYGSKMYKFYKEKVEPVTECCDLNQ